MTIRGREQSAPSTPSTATAVLYVKSDGLWYTKDDAGVENSLNNILAIPFFIAGTLTTGTKLPEFIADRPMTVYTMRGRCNSGASATYRPAVNGTAGGTTSASTGTSVVTTAQSVTLAAGDRLALNIVAAGTGSDLSVTFWARVG